MGQHRTPSAVMLLLFRQRQGHREVLLQHRRGVEVLDNLWDTAVTGHVQQGESMRQAVCREAKEELGIDIAPEDLAFRGLSHVLVSPGYTYYNGYFEALTWRGTPKIMEPDKCDGLTWFSVDQLPEDLIQERRLVGLEAGQGVRYYETGF